MHHSVNADRKADRWRCGSTNQLSESVVASAATERPLLTLFAREEILPGAPRVVIEPANESRCINDRYTDRGQSLSNGGGVCRTICAEVTRE
jgi:hypothetical protein